MDWRRCEETWPFPKVEAADNTKIETDVLPKKKKIKLSSILQPNSNDLREFVCGWGSAVINITVTYPINKIIFRQVGLLFFLFDNFLTFSYITFFFTCVNNFCF